MELMGEVSVCESMNTPAAHSHPPVHAWIARSAHGVAAPKLSVRDPSPDERGKGGVFAAEDINAMEIIASVPRGLVLRPCQEAKVVAAPLEIVERFLELC